jgi:adenylate cyclase
MQAAVIGTLVNNVNIERPDWAPGAELLALILISLIILFLSRWVYVGLGVGVVLLVSIVPVSMYLFDTYKILFDAVVPVAGGVLVMLHAYGIKFVSEFLQKQQIKKQFGTYLSPAMVEKLQKDPSLLKLGGETRELSIMFTDVRGFTTISEHYGKDVQGLTQIMNRYMTAMTAKIIENEGTLDKYIGDAQMAFWNAPLDDKDHAVNAVKTGLVMLEDLDEFNKEIAKENIPAFGMGLGINTGDVVVGNMGSVQRFDYTCLGDSVNLASRLEGQSKNYGVRIVLGPKTAEYVKDAYPVVEMDCIAVKGKTEGVKIYTVGKTVAYMHNEYLKEYYRGDWKKAIDWARKMINNDEVTISQYYELMIERLEEGTPPEWDGTYRATSK